MVNKDIRLEELIKESKFSKKEIAETLEINPRTLTRWERGESIIPSDKAQKLADFFGVSAGYLLGYSEKEESNFSDWEVDFDSMSPTDESQFFEIYDIDKKDFLYSSFIKAGFVLSDRSFDSIVNLIENISSNDNARITEIMAIYKDESRFQAILKNDYTRADKATNIHKLINHYKK
ncbi:hypothetical protein SAG0027_03860 [Streptococcus agalactiae FSL S3-251]|uniref:helix-turn-helix domain-containing protein n=1 Tax=Streptococcus agalactiae TaxID=1311 RepID=UPI0002F4A77E|nr:helix-turn-helix transcriptional regulator [Streptococcus agalactiae]EPV90442.1 hypothetical protein SAG0027_03860 [Streptococcus agalactiae FSL S3-251]